MWVLNVGLFGSAGAGVGGAITTGVSLGYSKEMGLTFGIFSSESVGAEFSIDAALGMSVSFDVFSAGVESGITETLTIGGSANVGISVGGDLTLDLDRREGY